MLSIFVSHMGFPFGHSITHAQMDQPSLPLISAQEKPANEDANQRRNVKIHHMYGLYQKHSQTNEPGKRRQILLIRTRYPRPTRVTKPKNTCYFLHELFPFPLKRATTHNVCFRNRMGFGAQPHKNSPGV